MKNKTVTFRLLLPLFCAVVLSTVAAQSTRAQKNSDADVVLVGAGDIADCADLSGAEATAKLLDGIPGTVFTTGDNAYEVRGCQPGSVEEKWLREDLQSHPAACTLAYWHKPLFSSGAKHGNDPEVKTFWQDLYEARAAVVINGHDHDYERFALQNPEGKADAARGIREFVAGTGGKSHRPFATPLATSEVRNADTYGVLKLTLHAKSYDWEFVPEAGKTFRDSGSDSCR